LPPKRRREKRVFRRHRPKKGRGRVQVVREPGDFGALLHGFIAQGLAIQRGYVEPRHLEAIIAASIEGMALAHKTGPKEILLDLAEQAPNADEFAGTREEYERRYDAPVQELKKALPMLEDLGL
jgi:hypothetical protein